MHTKPTQTEKYIEQGVLWIRAKSRSAFWAVFGGTLLCILFIGFWPSIIRETENETAWTQLGLLQGELDAGEIG